jgi:hypothetical protein
LVLAISVLTLPFHVDWAETGEGPIKSATAVSAKRVTVAVDFLKEAGKP